MTVYIGVGDDPPITTVAELDERLNRVTAELTEPTLVRLTTGHETFYIGLGNPHCSIALYLDDYTSLKRVSEAIGLPDRWAAATSR